MIRHLKLVQSIRFSRPICGDVGGMYPGPYGLTMEKEDKELCRMELSFFVCDWEKDETDPCMVNCVQEYLDDENGLNDLEMKILSEYMLNHITNIDLWRVPLDDQAGELDPVSVDSAVFEIEYGNSIIKKISVPCALIRPTHDFPK